MICDAVDELPHPSMAVHVLFTEYDPAQAPAVVKSDEVKVNELPQPSEAVATANTGVAGQLMVEGAGKVAITGGVMSSSLMV